MNYKDIDKNIPIYRYFRLNDLLLTLTKRTLHLVNPCEWQDPYESYLFDAFIHFNNEDEFPINHEINLASNKHDFYAQCWTKKQNCDGLWRNYRDNEACVRVKTTPLKICSQLEHLFHDDYSRFFIGKVNYVSNQQLKEKLILSWDTMFSKDGDQTFNHVIELLLLKREAFSYEEEVRLIYNGLKERTSVIKRSIDLPIDPVLLFEELVVDPFTTEEEYNKIRKKISEVCPELKERVSHSDLYKTGTKEHTLLLHNSFGDIQQLHLCAKELRTRIDC